MSILKVARIGHPAVRSEARALTLDELRSPALQKLIDDMVETMYEYEGVGLAAPQVHLSLRLAVLEVKGSDERARDALPLTVLVNPKVTPIGTKKASAWEGCLSVPDLRGLVPRFERLKLEALDAGGRWQPLPDATEIAVIAPKGELRRAATREMKERGVEYLVLFESDYGFGGVAASPASWGLSVAGNLGGARLYKIE